MQGKFFTFSQNNSGGSFEYDERAGITHYVIIEAFDIKHAMSRAESIGLYFDGVEKGMDCDCCGDRWHAPWSDGESVPEVYGKPASTVEKSSYFKSSQKEIAIHYLDGRIDMM